MIANLVEVKFVIAIGKQREQRSCQVQYRRPEIVTQKRPAYKEVVMTDGVRPFLTVDQQTLLAAMKRATNECIVSPRMVY